jgi:hypothetical protein
LGKNEDFFMALWIFRPKTVIFRGVRQLISRLSPLLPSQWAGFGLFPRRCSGHLEVGTPRYRPPLKKFAAPSRIDRDSVYLTELARTIRNSCEVSDEFFPRCCHSNRSCRFSP